MNNQASGNDPQYDEEGLEIPQINLLELTQQLVDEGYLGPDAINELRKAVPNEILHF